MSIDFKCPNRGILTSFPDVYAGMKFRCKYCTEYHSLPKAENSTQKDILSACPKTDEVVVIDSSIKTNRFNCASCGEVHEFPGDLTYVTIEIASSTKFQSQNREKIIPSVRKKSSLSVGSDSSTYLKQVPPSNTTNQTDRKTQTERKKTNSKQEKAGTGTEERIRLSKIPPKKSFSFTNFFIILFLIGLAIGALYLLTKSEQKATNIEDLNTKYLSADKEVKLGNFDVAIKLTDEVILAYQLDPKLKIKLNSSEIEAKNLLYKKLKENYLILEKDFIDDLKNTQISKSALEKTIAHLKEVTVSQISDQAVPIIAALNRLQLEFNKKYTDLIKQMVNKKLTVAEEIYSSGNYQESFYRVLEINKLIGAQSKENLTILTTEFNKRLKRFEETQKSYTDINTSLTKAIATPALIIEIEKELKDINNNLGLKDSTLKNYIDQKITILNEQKKILEVRNIDNPFNKDKADIRKKLNDYLAQLNQVDYVVKQEVIKHISHVSAQIRELPTFQQTNIEILKLAATEIGETLNEKEEPLTVKIDADKSRINLHDGNTSYTAGFLEIDGKSHFMIDMNGIRVAFAKDFFEKNMRYFVKQAKYMHDALLLYGGEKAYSNEPWVITEELHRIGAPVAIQKGEKGNILFLIDQVYTLTLANPFISNEISIKQTLKDQIAKTKTTILSSNEPLEIKANILCLLEKLNTSETTKLISFAPSKNWLFNGNYELLVKDANCLKALAELRNIWTQTFEKQTLWLEGATENKNICQLYRVNGNRVYGRLYNPEKVETSFLLTTAEPMDLICNDLSLHCSYLNTYQGNFPTLPTQNPLRIFTLHPTAGIICIFDSIANKIESNLLLWNKAFEQSIIFGKSGSSGTTLPVHSLKIDINGNITEIHSNNFNLEIDKIQNSSKDAFEKWIKENKKSIKSLEDINLLLLYFYDHSSLSLELQAVLNEPFNIEAPSISLSKGKWNGFTGAIPLLISSLATNLGRPNTILYIDNEFRNVWLEKTFDKQFLITYNDGFINKIPSEDFLKDLKTCLQNKSNLYYSPYTVPTAFIDKLQKRWSFANMSGLLISDVLSDEQKLEALETVTHSSPIKLIDLLNNSSAKTLKELDLIFYPIAETQSNFNLASDQFNNGVKAIQKTNTLSMKLEQARLLKISRKEKASEDLYEEILQSIFTNEIFKNEPEKLKDLRIYLAKEISGLGKISSAMILLGSEKKSAVLNIEDLKMITDVFFNASCFFDKKKINSTEFKTELMSMQAQLEKSFNYYFEQQNNDINSILELNLAWVKIQSCINGIDNTDQQLLIAPSLKANLLVLNGPELSKQQWDWAKQNPLCYELVIQQFFKELETDKEIEVKQKINISLKLIAAMDINIGTENSAWKKHPFQSEKSGLSLFTNLSENKWSDAATTIKTLLNANKPELSFYKYLAIISVTLNQNDFNSMIDGCIKNDLPDQFYRKLTYQLLALKLNKKAKSLGTYLKEKLPDRQSLISDIEKANQQ